MKLVEYCREQKTVLPIKLIARIADKHPNHLNWMWKNGKVAEVKKYIAYAEEAFRSICIGADLNG